MAQQVYMGAIMTCSFGISPSSLVVLPTNHASRGELQAATIMDNVPCVNIPPFGMCMSPANPSVAEATAAALGVYTPMPCIPVTATPWAAGATTEMVGNLPAFNTDSKLICCWGGVIQIITPGQFPVRLP